MFKVFKAAFKEVNRISGPRNLMEATAIIQTTLGSRVLGLDPVNGGELNCAAADRRAKWMEHLPGKSIAFYPTVTARARPAAPNIPGENKTFCGQFLSASFTGKAGTRPYKIYVPGGYRAGSSLPLIVMLHGCTQSPDDFAAGTRMNY